MGLLNLFKRSPAPRAPKPVMRSLAAPPAAEREVALSLPEVASPPMPPDPSDLRRMLFDAIATGNEEKLAHLCRDHHDFLLAYAATWSVVPEALNANPDAAKWYARGLHAITQFCAERLERPELQERFGNADNSGNAPTARQAQDCMRLNDF